MCSCQARALAASAQGVDRSAANARSGVPGSSSASKSPILPGVSPSPWPGSTVSKAISSASLPNAAPSSGDQSRSSVTDSSSVTRARTASPSSVPSRKVLTASLSATRPAMPLARMATTFVANRSSAPRHRLGTRTEGSGRPQPGVAPARLRWPRRAGCRRYPAGSARPIPPPRWPRRPPGPRAGGVTRAATWLFVAAVTG